MEIDCIFGERFSGGARTLRVIGTYTRGVYFSDGTSVFLLHDLRFGKIAFGIGVCSIEELVERHVFPLGQLWNYSRGRLTHAEVAFVGEAGKIQPFPACREGEASRLRERLASIGKGAMAELLRGKGGSAYAARAKRRIRELFSALRADDGERIARAAENMIGLGYGLTPDMDDFLIGVLYTLHMRERGSRLIALSKGVGRAKGATSLISGEYLSCALRGGQFDLVTAVVCDPSDERSIDLLLSAGSSSGSSICAGIACTMAWLKGEEDAI